MSAWVNEAKKLDEQFPENRILLFFKEKNNKLWWSTFVGTDRMCIMSKDEAVLSLLFMAAMLGEL
jgi:hypothetical protein